MYIEDSTKFLLLFLYELNLRKKKQFTPYLINFRFN